MIDRGATPAKLTRSGATMIPVIAELLDELASRIPDLHDAACRGHAALFDVADPTTIKGSPKRKRSAPERPTDVSHHYRQGAK